MELTSVIRKIIDNLTTGSTFVRQITHKCVINRLILDKNYNNSICKQNRWHIVPTVL